MSRDTCERCPDLPGSVPRWGKRFSDSALPLVEEAAATRQLETAIAAVVTAQGSRSGRRVGAVRRDVVDGVEVGELDPAAGETELEVDADREGLEVEQHDHGLVGELVGAQPPAEDLAISAVSPVEPGSEDPGEATVLSWVVTGDAQRGIAPAQADEPTGPPIEAVAVRAVRRPGEADDVAVSLDVELLAHVDHGQAKCDNAGE